MLFWSSLNFYLLSCQSLRCNCACDHNYLSRFSNLALNCLTQVLDIRSVYQWRPIKLIVFICFPHLTLFCSVFRLTKIIGRISLCLDYPVFWHTFTGGYHINTRFIKPPPALRNLNSQPSYCHHIIMHVNRRTYFARTSI